MSLSSGPENFELKCMGITSLCCDIIFLSNIRLGEIAGQAGNFKVSQALTFNKH
jgi:hypothetical protein